MAAARLENRSDSIGASLPVWHIAGGGKVGFECSDSSIVRLVQDSARNPQALRSSVGKVADHHFGTEESRLRSEQPNIGDRLCPGKRLANPGFESPESGHIRCVECHRVDAVCSGNEQGTLVVKPLRDDDKFFLTKHLSRSNH